MNQLLLETRLENEGKTTDLSRVRMCLSISKSARVYRQTNITDDLSTRDDVDDVYWEGYNVDWDVASGRVGETMRRVFDI